VSKLFDKTNTFACTQFIEEGTLALREKAEYRTDKDLYHVIRLQRIIENVDKIANATDSEADAQAAYLRVRTELEEFRVFLCSDVSDSRKSAPTATNPPTKHAQNSCLCSSTPQSSFCTTSPSLSDTCSRHPACI
jgi:3-methyladenine DNA glycosylase Tag